MEENALATSLSGRKKLAAYVREELFSLATAVNLLWMVEAELVPQ